MFWQDDNDQTGLYEVPDTVVDVNFKIKCSHIPLDHAHALSQVIVQRFPWIRDHKHAGLHLIHGAESGNGWYRPTDPSDFIYPSKRTLFTLRVPKEHIDDAKTLAGQTIQLLNTSIEFNKPTIRPLYKLATLFSRYIVSSSDTDESVFLTDMATALSDINIHPKKMLSGRTAILRFPQGPILTRSLMIDGIEPAESVRLQQQGIGDGRHYGCGLFLPHKGIDAVGDAQEK